MRFFPWVLAAGVAAAGCGLDADGLDPSEAGATSADGTTAEDATSVDGGIGDATLGDAPGSEAKDSGGGASTDTGARAEAGPSDGAGSDDVAGDDASEAGATDSGADTAAEAATDSAAGDAGMSDAAADACGSVEICNNGIDDNCNGLIDCADPECTPAWTCTSASIPSGWTVVEYVENARPSCSTGYGTSLDVVEGPSGAAATCTCTCDVTTSGSCETGSFTVLAGLGSCFGSATSSPGNGGACSPATVDYFPVAGSKLQLDPLGYAPGSCTPDPTVTVPDAGFAGQGRLCIDTEGSGGGCANGGACVPTAQGSGLGLCISHDGIEACPTGFTSSYTVGTTITDTRGCSPCTCGGATANCANASLTLFTDGACGDAGVVVAADAGCNDFPGATGGPTYVAYEYMADVQGEGCQASPGSPDGGVSLAKPHTVCCQ